LAILADASQGYLAMTVRVLFVLQRLSVVVQLGFNSTLLHDSFLVVDHPD